MSSGFGETSPGITASTAVTGGGAAVGPATVARAAMNSAAILEPGAILGERYVIQQMLGLGGMGAVYKAYDRQIDQVIALKVIRPDLANNAELLTRFKQELLLARRISHKNVVRIFDVHESSGITFITMEYIAGQDLHSVLTQQGKLSPEEAIGITRQVCAALAAAHAEGILHRDLKPNNIMREASGRVVLMDFGLARMVEGEGMTQTGVMLGTIEYMSPEQARAEALDARSDLFAVGLVLYELLTGNMPYKADSALASLLKRTQEPAPPISRFDPTLPPALTAVVAKCLEREREKRYASAEELIAQLDILTGRRPSTVTPSPAFAVSRKKWAWVLAIAVVAVAVAVTAGMRLLRPRALPVAHKPVAVLVADFQNHTGDPIFDDTLEPMFNLALEGASFINAYNRGEARKAAQHLPTPSEKLDEQTARLVAVSQGLAAVITGSLSRRGDGYKLAVEALDANTGYTIASADVSAASKDDLLLAIAKLAAPVRQALGDATPESVQLDALRGAFMAASLEVVHQYGVAMQQQVSGNMEAALQSFSKAVELDPNFARGYAGRAAVEGNLGQLQAAEADVKRAMEHVDRMTERERFRVRGLYYARTGNWQKCVEEYSDLVKQFPADDVGHNNLAFCYKRLHNTPKAIEELKQTLTILPKNLIVRMNLALYAAYAGDPQTAQQEATAVLRANPSYEKAYAALAYAQVQQGQIQPALSTYRDLQKVSDLGRSLAASGIGDIAVYEGRYLDAARSFEQGAQADLKTGRADSAAASLAALADVYLLRDRRSDALAALQKALQTSQSASVRFRAARIFVAAGMVPEARKLAAGLAAEKSPESQVFARLVEGEAALSERRPRDAIEILNAANAQLDTWIGHLDLGRAYLQAGMFVEADSELDQCLKRRGDTLDLLDYVPTYGYLPEVYYLQGRVREGLRSPGFRDSYRTYLGIRAQAGEDPLLADVRRRIGP